MLATKLKYDRQLMHLCKMGKLTDAMNLVNQVIINGNKEKHLSHYTLSALLNACIHSKNYNEYRVIWDKCINEYKIEPNCISYLIAICAASHCNDSVHIEQLLSEMKKYPLETMKQFHWNQLFDSLGRVNNIQWS